jgi:hypothetical protein
LQDENHLEACLALFSQPLTEILQKKISDEAKVMYLPLNSFGSFYLRALKNIFCLQKLPQSHHLISIARAKKKEREKSFVQLMRRG